MLVDDVITAGTGDSRGRWGIQAHGATLAGVLISLDRQERGRGGFPRFRKWSATMYFMSYLHRYAERPTIAIWKKNLDMAEASGGCAVPENLAWQANCPVIALPGLCFCRFG